MPPAPASTDDAAAAAAVAAAADPSGPKLRNGPAGGAAAGRPRRKRRRANKSKSSKADVPATSGRFNCDYCKRDVSDTVRIRCVECLEYDLCLDCFSVGAESEDHKSHHAYRVLEVVDREVFEEGWSAAEEERLLEALEYYGVGNWSDVASMVGRGKNAEYCKEHYRRAFLEATPQRLPNIRAERLLPKPPTEEIADKPEPDPKSLKVMHHHQVDEMSGYLPKRGEYMYEWDNEREEILADMEIEDGDTKQDRELKMRVLEIYNTRLDARAARRQFALDAGYTDVKGKQAAERKMDKETRDLWERTKPLRRLAAGEQPQREMVERLLQERHLRERIEDLRNAREQANVRTLAAAKPFIGRAKLGTDGPGRVPPTLDELAREVDAPPAAGARAGETPEQRKRRRLAQVHERDLFYPSEMRKQSGAELFCMDGAELLGGAELELCENLRLSPHQYLVVKDALVQEQARTGHVRRKEVKELIGVEEKKTLRIYDYLVSARILVPSAAGGGGGSGSRAGSKSSAAATVTAGDAGSSASASRPAAGEHGRSGAGNGLASSNGLSSAWQ